MSEALSRYGGEDGMGLVLAVDPTKVLEKAKAVGDVLMSVIDKRDKDGEPLFYQKIGKNRHLKVEAWQFLGHFFALAPRLDGDVTTIVDELSGAAGFRATIEVIDGLGAVRGRASAICLNNEDNWSVRPKYEWVEGKGGSERKIIGAVPVPSYQLASMAQTRATSKALAGLLRWIVVLSGFSGTPAEEMTGEKSGTAKQAQEAEQHKPRKISDGQRKRLFAIAKDSAFPFNDLPEFFKKHGFEQAADITMEKYDLMIKEIEAHKPAA